jgi:hypothetical protein
MRLRDAASPLLRMRVDVFGCWKVGLGIKTRGDTEFFGSLFNPSSAVFPVQAG